MSLITPDSGLLFWMVVIFGIVFFILAKFGFPVITSMVRKRTESINDALKKADEAWKTLADLNEKQEAIVAKATNEQNRILADTAKMRADIIAKASEDARKEADKILAGARAEIVSEKEAALADIRKDVAILAVEIAEKVLMEKFSSEQEQKTYVDKVLSEFDSHGNTGAKA